MIDWRRPPSCRFSRSDGVSGRAGAGEEVEDDGIWLVLHEEPNGVLDGVQGLREREVAARDERAEEARSVCRRVVRPSPARRSVGLDTLSSGSTNNAWTRRHARRRP